MGFNIFLCLNSMSDTNLCTRGSIIKGTISYTSPFMCSIHAQRKIFKSYCYYAEPGELMCKQPELSCSSLATVYLKLIVVILISIFTYVHCKICDLINDLT